MIKKFAFESKKVCNLCRGTYMKLEKGRCHACRDTEGKE